LPANDFIREFMGSEKMRKLVEQKAFKKFHDYEVLRYKQRIKKNGEKDYEVWMKVDND